MDKPLLLLVDGNSLLHRAYHALPPLTNSQGQPTNAVFGLAQMLLSLLKEHRPEAALVAFDAPGPTFRHEEFPEYKAHRAEAPGDLVPQFSVARELVEALGLPQAEEPGYEADDLIAGFARQAADQGYEVLVVTGDRDLVQLVDDRIRVLATLRGVGDTRLYDTEQVREEWGLEPAQLADFKGLAGDPSDGLPGVPGIGKKTATALLQQFGSVEGVLEHREEVTPTRFRALLEEHAEAARLSKRLARLTGENLPLRFAPQELHWEGYDPGRLRTLLLRLEFTRLLDRVTAEEVPEPEVALAQGPEMETVLRRAREKGALYVASAWQGETLVGLALSAGGGDPAYLSLAETAAGDTLFPETTEAELPAQLAEALAEEGLGKHGPDLKQLARALRGRGVRLSGYTFDPMIADYVLAPHRHDHTPDKLAAEYLGEHLPGSGQPGARAAAVAALLPALEEKLAERLRAAGLEGLFERVEMPLAPVLAEMEAVGIAVDVSALQRLDERFSGELTQLSARMFELAGVEFNPDSPAQVGRVLFETLELPGGKRTKTGWATGAEILENLAGEHEIARLLLQYREYAKLRSTYVKGLLAEVSPATGRLHTTLEQTVTATGRLSSRAPNLQNIPVRTELGREIRACFVAGGPERVLLSADYSQIELRLLAHFAGVPSLCEAFEQGQDVHAATAALLFGVALEEVTGEQRRIAKTVNYAVMYGMGPGALAQQIGVSREEAAGFIEQYFERLSGVRQYLDQVIAAAEEQGFVETLLGRRRYLPELKSGNPGVRAYAQRAAANTPLQGSAADLIKMAMVEVARRLPGVSGETALLLQVHDELLFETPSKEVEKVAQSVKEIMQSAWKLTVPLVADVKVGPNWRDMEEV